MWTVKERLETNLCSIKGQYFGLRKNFRLIARSVKRLQLIALMRRHEMVAEVAELRARWEIDTPPSYRSLSLPKEHWRPVSCNVSEAR
jgi:hypothetical protein